MKKFAKILIFTLALALIIACIGIISFANEGETATAPEGKAIYFTPNNSYFVDNATYDVGATFINSATGEETLFYMTDEDGDKTLVCYIPEDLVFDQVYFTRMKGGALSTYKALVPYTGGNHFIYAKGQSSSGRGFWTTVNEGECLHNPSNFFDASFEGTDCTDSTKATFKCAKCSENFSVEVNGHHRDNASSRCIYCGNQPEIFVAFSKTNDGVYDLDYFHENYPMIFYYVDSRDNTSKQSNNRYYSPYFTPEKGVTYYFDFYLVEEDGSYRKLDNKDANGKSTVQGEDMSFYCVVQISSDTGDFSIKTNCSALKRNPVATVNGVNYQSLQEAIDVCPDGGTVAIYGNTTYYETTTIVIPKGKTITLDTKSKTINVNDHSDKNYAFIENNGNLTITGNGTINVTSSINSGWNRASAVIVNNPGATLTVGVLSGSSYIGANLYHKGGTDMAYVIDARTNGNLGDVTTILRGGIYNSTYRSVRQFCNSTTCENNLSVEGGTFYGAVFVHDANNNANLGSTTFPKYINNTTKLSTARLNQDSKKVRDTCFYVWGQGDSSGISVSVEGGTFSHAVAVDNGTTAPIDMSITGGTFSKPVANFLKDGYLQSGTSIKKLAGSGTEEDPYLISSVNDLTGFRDLVNAGDTFYNAPGVYVALSANINMSGKNWNVNIGDGANTTFDGIFDGKGFTISNLTVTESEQTSDGYVCSGLFGAISGTAVIKNLNLENVTINTGDYTGNNVGALVGFAWSATGTIENVHVKGTIKIDAKEISGVGALVGYAYGGKLNINNCSVIANDGSYINGGAYVGSLIGYAGGVTTISGCSAENIVLTADCCIGGIAGLLLNGGLVDASSVVNVAVTATHENWYNSAAAVVGTITGNITVTDTEIVDVTKNGKATGSVVGSEWLNKPTTPVAGIAASINGVYYKNLADAINAAQDGDTIILGEGTFACETVVSDYINRFNNKNITIQGAPNHGTVLTGGIYIGYDDNNPYTGSVTISGVAFEGKGISLVQLDSVSILDCKFNNISENAIYVAGDSITNSITISGNVIDNAKVGIRVRNALALTIDGNTISNTQHNSITVEHGATHAANTAPLTITNNTLSNWGLGGEGRAMRIALGAMGVAARSSKVVTVSGNTLSNDNAPEEFIKMTDVDASMTVALEDNLLSGTVANDGEYIAILGNGADNVDLSDNITVAGNEPHILDGFWWVGDYNTGIRAEAISVDKAEVNENNELVITLTNGAVLNLGNVKGDTGRGIANVTINANCELVVEYTDGTSAVLGNVKGDTGVGIQNVEIIDYKLIVTLTDGTVLDLGNIRGQQGVGVEKVDLVDNKLIVTLTDGTIFDLGNVRGDDGVGIEKVKKNENNELVITLTNGLVLNLGNVKGDTGVGIETIEKNDKNELLITLTDGTVLNLGNIKGDQGIQGEKGEKGDTGADGNDNNDVVVTAIAIATGAIILTLGVLLFWRCRRRSWWCIR